MRSLLVDFRNPSTVYAGTDMGVLRSEDSGQTWGGMGPGLPGSVTIYALQLSASNYAQLLAATGDVYMFPATSSQFSLVRILPVLLFALLFYVLYRYTRRNRKARRDMARPKQVIEQAGPPEA